MVVLVTVKIAKQNNKKLSRKNTGQLFYKENTLIISGCCSGCYCCFCSDCYCSDFRFCFRSEDFSYPFSNASLK